MNRRQIVLLVLVVAGLHGLLFWWLAGSVRSSIPKKASDLPGARDFKSRIYELTDKETGERYIYKEFQVSTRLALPDILMEKENDPPGENPYRLDIFPLPLREPPKRE